MTKSLREKILTASSEVEIENLLSAGQQYELASARTRARRRSAARKRRKELA